LVVVLRGERAASSPAVLRAERAGQSPAVLREDQVVQWPAVPRAEQALPLAEVLHAGGLTAQARHAERTEPSAA
jgi:hypothetical protein